MDSHYGDIRLLAEEFEDCRKILIALGDENRQHLILEMLKMEQCSGVRVGMITEKTHLSRPAVSHHIQILREAGLLKMRREGTKNYYYLSEAMEARPSVRQYKNKPLEQDVVLALQTEIDACNRESGLHIQLVKDEPKGVLHKSKSMSEVAKSEGQMPDWFKHGVQAALLAPTAMNQQKFVFALKENQVLAKAGVGFYTKVDLGIAKYHFEIGVGDHYFEWVL